MSLCCCKAGLTPYLPRLFLRKPKIFAKESSYLDLPPCSWRPIKCNLSLRIGSLKTLWFGIWSRCWSFLCSLLSWRLVFSKCLRTRWIQICLKYCICWQNVEQFQSWAKRGLQWQYLLGHMIETCSFKLSNSHQQHSCSSPKCTWVDL